MNSVGPKVQIEGLHASYRNGFRRLNVLAGADFKAGSGEVVGIVGPNGAGKTTLFRVLTGFLMPDAGSCQIDEMAPTEYRQRHGIGFMPESCRPPSTWSANQLLARGVDLGVSAALREHEYQVATSRTGLDHRTLRRALRKASKGTRRRAVLAYALIGDPKLVVLDEPFSGLDPPSRVALRTNIQQAAARSATVIVSSHNLDEVARVATSMYLLSRGRMSDAPVDADTIYKALSEEP